MTDYAILLDGERVASTKAELQVTPSRKLTRAERAELDTQAERIGAFLGLEPALTVE
jgi:hypothetical protein